jgi:hypothetical protein
MMMPGRSNADSARRARWSEFVLAGILWLSIVPPTSATLEPMHRAWDELVKRHVHEGLIDYRGFMADRQLLDRYLAQLADVDQHLLPALSSEEQLTFWINLYNACVVGGVLDHSPVDSVKQVPGFFTSKRCRVSDQELTIDEVGAQGHAVGGYRIHFALVCASRGCPVLRDEAYVAERLNAQLADQARTYLDAPSRGLRLDEVTSTVWVSKIFHWNRTDFKQPRGWLGVYPPMELAPLVEVLEPHLEPELAATLREGKWSIRVMDYDWSLNEVARE